MEAALVHLDDSIRSTENKLDSINVQISEYENFSADSQFGVLEQISLLKLLQSVSEVKREYEKIRKEIMEVQALQHQLANSLQSQVQLLQGRSKMLKEKILDKMKIEKV
ncbi:uncharacterized protein LOC124155932 [Ischnura elegans]|uniref:uncharacterized protein LOC124155932 n=1 Tax=Ischnura elegans TaxID=197161 RepID=UPI001ED8B0A5|nr:uncharacterized protein LOC124155932 [Ischnura elegans]